MPSRRPGRPSVTFPEEQRQLKFDEWPRPFQEAWIRAHVADDWDSDATAADLADTTKQHRQKVVGSLLNHVRLTGGFEADTAIEEIVTPDIVAGWVQFSIERGLAASTVRERIYTLRDTMLHLVAGGDWRWIRKVTNAPTTRAVMASRRQPALHDPAVLRERGLARMEAILAAPPSIRTAQHFRDVLIVLFANARPLRVKNLAAMRLDVHLERVGDGYWFSFAEHELKNHRRIDGEFPPDLTTYMDIYLETYRPLLLRDRDHDSVWVCSHSGAPLHPTAFRNVFRTTGEVLIGRPLHPHSVRYAYATYRLESDPMARQEVADGLGHANMRSVEKFYDRSTHSASRRIWTDRLRDLSNMPDAGMDDAEMDDAEMDDAEMDLE